MNKNKTIMAAIGGIALVAALVFGYLAFAAWSERGETRERVADERSNANRILSSAVPPTQESLTRINANTKAYADWRDATRALLAEGDVVIDRNASATSFKAAMGDDARALAKLPGGAEGKIVRDGFDFGFKSYIIDGNIPDEKSLPLLKRQWAEVKAMVEILSASGAVELLGVEVSEAPKKAEEPKEQPRRGFGARRQAAAEPAKPAFETVNYTLRFTARPLAVVKTLNAFAASAHLMYVEDLSLVREKDMLGEMLGAGKKEAEAGGRRSRARRGRRNEEEQQAAEGEEQARKGLVTDPQIEAPFVVTLRVATIDFGTNGAPADAADADGKGKSDEKEEEE